MLLAGDLPPDMIVGRTLSAYSLADVVNGQLSITYTVYNQREVDLAAVVLNTTLATGIDFQTSSSAANVNGQSVAWNLGMIPAHGRSSVTLTVGLSAAATAIDSGAFAAGSIDGGAAAADTPAIVLSAGPIASELLVPTLDANTADPVIQEQAARLRYDPQAIFDYLNSDIGYESYVGSLRGARGTVWTNAGNSLDEASLGVALYRASGIPARYAHGELSSDDARALLGTMFPDPTQIVGYLAAGAAVADPLHDSTLLDETRDHYWVQIDVGAGFQDADTSGLAGSAIGTSHTAATSTFDAVPDNLRHKVRISVDAETYNEAAGAFSGNGITTATVLDRTWNSVELVGKPITVSQFVNDANLGGLAFTSRSLAYTPYFLLGDAADPTGSGDEIFTGMPFQELLTNFPLGSQILTGLFLNMDLAAPGGAVEHHERALVDRLGFASRTNGTTATLSVDANGQAALSPADVFTLSVLPGKSDPRDPVPLQADVIAQQAYLAQFNGIPVESLPADYFDRLNAFTTAATRLLSQYNNRASDAMTDVIAERALVRAYADHPRLVLVSGRLLSGSDTEPGTVKFEVDLRDDSVRVVNSPGQSVDAVTAFNLLRGLAATILEYNTIASLLPEAEQATVVNTYNVFRAAESQNIPIVLLTPMDLPSLAGRITASSDALARISTAVSAGRIVMVPERPVSLGDTATTSWYEINTTTGELISVGENGGHNSALEYAILRATVFGFLSGVITFGFGTFVPEYKAQLALALSAAGALTWAHKAITNGGVAAGSAAAVPLAFLGGFGSAFTLMGIITGKDPPAEGMFLDVEPVDTSLNHKTVSTSLAATAGQSLQLTPASTSITTDQNTSATIPFSMVTDFADQYLVSATAPAGWIVSLTTSAVTITPAPGTQSGAGIVRLVGRSLSDSEHATQADITVSVTPTTPGITSDIVFDPLLTVPYQGAQLPTGYQAIIRNLGPTSDSYTLTFSNVTPGWEVITTAPGLTIPAGETGILGVYLRPTSATIPAPGEPVSFTATVTSTAAPTITQAQTVNFAMPEVAATIFLPSPASISTFPDTTVSGVVSVKNRGNITETVTLSASLPTSGITIDGLPQTLTLAPGDVVDVPYTINVASSVPLLTTGTLLLSLDKLPTGATEPFELGVPIQIVVPGTDAIATASVAARQLGNADLADRLDTLSASLTNLVAAPTDPVANGQAVAALDAVIRFVNSDPALASNFASSLTFARNQLASATTTEQVQSALSFLASMLETLSQTLAEKVLHGFTFALASNVVTALPGAPARFPILLENTGTEPTTFELSVGGFLPFGTTATFTESTVTLQPGERLDGGPNGVTLSLDLPAGDIFPTGFVVIAMPQEAPSLTQQVSASIAVRAEFVQVATVTPSPAFIQPGGAVSVAARILNVVNREQAANVSYRVTDSGGATVFTSAETPITLDVQASLMDVSLPPIDTTGLAQGDYTIIVFVTDAAGDPITGGTGQAALLIGTPVSATLSTSPDALLSVGSIVTNTLELAARTTFADPLTLLGQTQTTPTATTILVRGNIAYVAGTNGIDIVDITDSAAPEVIGTFGQGLIVDGGFTVIREMSGDRIVVATTAVLNASSFTLLTYSVANPTAPTLLGTSTIDESFISDLFIVGERAIATTNGISFFGPNIIAQFGDVLALDLANPSAVAVTDELFGDSADNFNQHGGVVADASTLYVASSTSTGGFGSTQDGNGIVRVIDYSNPASLSQIGEVTIPLTVHALAMAVEGNRALVVGSTGGWKTPFSGQADAQLTGRMTLTLLDISDRQNPVVLGDTLITESLNRPIDTADGGAKLSALSLGNGRFAISRGYIDGKSVLMTVSINGDQIAVAATEVPSLANEMAIVGDTLYTTSQTGVLIYNVGAIEATPVTVSVQVPNSNTFPNVNLVRPDSFNIPPDDIIAGAGFDTLVWYRPFAFGVTSSTLTWQTDISGLSSGESRDVTLGTDVSFSYAGTPGSFTLPATSVVGVNAVGISPAAQTAAPGAIATYTVTVSNPTNGFLHYTLSTMGVPNSWVQLERDVFVNAQSTTTVTLQITSPAATPTGPIDFVIFAAANASVQGTAQATLTLAGTPLAPDLAAHGVVAELLPAVAGQGTTADYIVRLTNTGSETETFALSANLPFNVSGTFTPQSVTIPAGTGSYRDVRLSLLPAVGTFPGQHFISITAASTSSSATDTVEGELEVVASGVSVDVTPATAIPGDALQVTITNTGTVADTFDLAIAGVPGIVATLSNPVVTLNPGDSQTLTIELDDINFASPAALDLFVSATSRANSAVRHVDSATITIAPTLDMEARFGDDTVERTGPGSAFLLLLVDNIGNVEDAYTASIDQVTGPATAALIGTDGLPTASVPIIRVPGQTTGVLLVDASLLEFGQATVRVKVQSLTDAGIVRFATATVQALVPGVTLSVSPAAIAEAGGVSTITASLAIISTLDVTVNLDFSGTATLTDDYTRTSAQIVIPAGELTGSITVTAVTDAFDEPDETIVVEITSVTNGQEGGVQQQTITILDDANSAPFQIEVPRTTVFRDQAGAWVSTVRVSDPNTDQTHAFTLSDPRFEVRDGNLFLKAGETITAADGNSLALTITATDNGSPPLSFSKDFVLTVVDSPGFACAYQWGPNKFDVNADGSVGPLDALLIINDLNAFGPRALPLIAPGTAPPPFLDVSCDNAVNPLDALLIINELNANGESEPPLPLVDSPGMDARGMAIWQLLLAYDQNASRAADMLADDSEAADDWLTFDEVT